ncbi:MAG: hypothetical protein MSC31_09955 [Solirubrobacteraceae bacterium MAG38_C4-C5]|nr:hypothetical protein [Candidatus Siliceabacter maunaloa]
MTAPRYLLVGHEREQLAVALAVLAIQRGDQQLDGAAHLCAQAVGDLLLALRAVGQQRGHALLDGHAEEAVGAQQRGEGAQGETVLLQPDLRPPGAGAPVVWPWRDHTSVQRSPSVTSARGMELARASSAARSIGLAAQPSPGGGRSSAVSAGTTCTSRTGTRRCRRRGRARRGRGAA